MTIKIFSSEELSNTDYHAETDHVSGSQLHKLFTTSPASFKYGVEMDDEGNPVEQKSRALEFGSCAHTNLLEQSKFEAEYMRGTHKNDVTEWPMIKTQAEAKQWLKDRGVVGYSNKGVDELWEGIQKACSYGEDVSFLPILEINQAKMAEASGRTLIRGDDYDACMKMREVLYMNGEVRNIIGKGAPEVSVFAEIEEVSVKVRFDYIYDWMIIDYKTTISAHPEQFGKQCYNAGYYLKMALQHDVFTLAYGREPSALKLLAQEKKLPFIPVMYRMSEEQLTIGRLQYRSALQQYRACKERDVWPAYGGGAEMELQTPNFVKQQYKDFIK